MGMDHDPRRGIPESKRNPLQDKGSGLLLPGPPNGFARGCVTPVWFGIRPETKESQPMDDGSSRIAISLRSRVAVRNDRVRMSRSSLGYAEVSPVPGGTETLQTGSGP